MSGPRKCCPCPDCITFGDHFDKCDPSLEEGGDCWYYYPDCPREWILATGGSCPPTTTGYAPPWSIDPDTGECIATQEHRPAWIPQGEPHGWYWARSLVPQYVGDGSLYEISGNGEIWCRAGWDEKSNGAPEGRTVTAYTIGELPNSKYRLLLNLEIDGPNAGDCLILEFYNSNPIEATPYLRLISRVGGVETIVKTVVLGYTDASGGFRGGRIIIFKYMADYSVVCASMGTTDLLSPLSYLCATEQTFEEAGASVPDGVHAGLGNASGDSIPVALDDFVLYRLEYRTADPRGLAYPSVLSPPCFTCSCLCDFVYLFPNKINLHITGHCRPHPPSTDCDPYGDPPTAPIIDETFTLYKRDDCGNTWSSGLVDFNGVECEFQLLCPGAPKCGGGLFIDIIQYQSGDIITDWHEDPPENDYTITCTGAWCLPHYGQTWTMEIGTAASSLFPGCRCGMGDGTFYLEASPAS